MQVYYLISSTVTHDHEETALVHGNKILNERLNA